MTQPHQPFSTQQITSSEASTLALAPGTACVVVGGSSLTTLSAQGEVKKHSFYPGTLEEYTDGITTAALQYGRLERDTPGILLVAAPGAFQHEGRTATLPPSFAKVKDDSIQRGMPFLFFNQLIEEKFEKRGYHKVKVHGYNDTVPALMATMSQPNTPAVLGAFEGALHTSDRSTYAIKYLINGTGTGEASLLPDTNKIITAEKGHLKPNLLWYELNPFYKWATLLPDVGQNRTIERLVAGGPADRTPRHFTKIFNTILKELSTAQAEVNQELALALGFANHAELRNADGSSPQRLLNDQGLWPELTLKQLGAAIDAQNPLGLALQRVFARALGTAFAHMHFAIGEMPDSPLNTYIGALDVRRSALGFIRSDGSTTALLGNATATWKILETGAQEYAARVLSSTERHLFTVLNMNVVFPHMHPDFGGLPTLAEKKRLKLLGKQ